MEGQCPCCNKAQSVGAAVGGKIACTVLGAALGKAAISQPLGAVACGFLGLVLGDFIDRQVLPRCPVCGTILQIVAAAT